MNRPSLCLIQPKKIGEFFRIFYILYILKQLIIDERKMLNTGESIESIERQN